MLTVHLKRRAGEAGLDSVPSVRASAASSSSGSSSSKQTARYTHRSGVDAAKQICNVLSDIPLEAVRKLVHDLGSQKRIEQWHVSRPQTPLSNATKRSLCAYLGEQLKVSVADPSLAAEARALCSARISVLTIKKLRELVVRLQASVPLQNKVGIRQITAKEIAVMRKPDLCQAVAAYTSLSSADIDWLLSDDDAVRQAHAASRDILGSADLPPHFIDPVSKRLNLTVNLRQGAVDHDAVLRTSLLLQGLSESRKRIQADAPNVPLQEDIDEWLRAHWGVSLSDMRHAAEMEEFAEWQLVRELGSGQDGAVSLYEHRASGRQIAIKAVKKLEYFQDTLENSRARVLQEIETLESLKSVCQKYLLCFDRAFLEVPGDYWYFATEYLDGYVPLSTLLEQSMGDLSDQQIANICVNMIRGIIYMHGHNVVHRDIHAGNVMVDQRTQDIKYIDFGRARQGGRDKHRIADMAYMRRQVEDILYAVKNDTKVNNLIEIDVPDWRALTPFDWRQQRQSWSPILFKRAMPHEEGDEEH